jgi:hypothetical protein
VGLIFSDPLKALQMPTPQIPAGTDPNLILLWMVAGSVLVALVLSWVARELQGHWGVRWAVLFALIWGGSAVNMVIEASLFTTSGAVASSQAMATTMVIYALPSLFLAGALALLFPPADSGHGLGESLRRFFAQRPMRSWLWRLPLAVLAFPVVYFGFGLLVQPFVADIYAEGLYEMQLPTWGQMIPVQLARGLLFLLISLPVIAAWRKGNLHLIAVLGMTFFVLLSFMSVLTAYWLPLNFRLIHGLEILVDSLVYVAVLIWLLCSSLNSQSVLVSIRGVILSLSGWSSG